MTISLDEIRAVAAREGLSPAAAELEGVAAFLAVFLPAVEELAQLLPEDGSGPAPAPLGVE